MTHPPPPLVAEEPVPGVRASVFVPLQISSMPNGEANTLVESSRLTDSNVNRGSGQAGYDIIYDATESNIGGGAGSEVNDAAEERIST